MPEKGRLRDKGHGDWCWLNNELMRSHLPHLGNYGLAVYCVLAMHASNTTQRTALHQRSIAKMVGCGLRTAISALELLEAQGLIKTESGKLYGRANAYVLLKVGVCTYDATTPGQMELESAPGCIPPQEETSTPKEGEVCGSVHTGYAAECIPGMQPGAEHIEQDYLNKTTLNQTKTEPPAQNSAQVNGAGGDTAPPLMPAEFVPIDPFKDRDTRIDRRPIIDAIDKAYKRKNPGVKVPWSTRAFLRLKNEVARLHLMTVDQWVACVENRFASEGVVVGELPETFIPYLARYIGGPLDRYGKVMEVGHANGAVPNSRAQRTRQSVDTVLREIDDYINAGANKVPDPHGGSHG
jgi:hypothetical protein